MSKESKIALAIYNISGQLVKTSAHEPKPDRYHNVRWDGRDEQGRQVAAGVYLYRIDAGQFNEVKKLTVIR